MNVQDEALCLKISDTRVSSKSWRTISTKGRRYQRVLHALDDSSHEEFPAGFSSAVEVDPHNKSCLDPLLSVDHEFYGYA